MKKNSKKIRIIVPTYNGERKVGKTISHLLGQLKGKKISVLVLANGCTDRTVNVLQQLSRKQGVEFYSLPQASKKAAMNEGMKLSAGYEYVAFLDDDCLVYWPAIKQAMGTLDENPSLNVLALQPKGIINSKSPIGKFWQKVFSYSVEHKFLKQPKVNLVGRFLIFRRKNWRDIPEKSLEDDLWLTLYHWPHIRTLYNWHVFYVPSSSLRSWWIRHHHKAAGRKQLQEMFPQKGKPKLTTHINWLSVFNPFNLPESFFFLVFRIVRRLNRLYYNRVPTEHRYNYIWYRDGTT